MPEASVPVHEDVHPLVWSPAAWVTEEYLRSWQMDIQDGINNLKMFLKSVYSKTQDKLAKELLDLELLDLGRYHFDSSSNYSSGWSMIF